MLIVNDTLEIPLSEIEMLPIRAQGPGGQNVNKVESAIHLRFDASASPSLPEDLKARLLASGDRRITADGVVVIKAQRYRSQEQNRQDALERLRVLISKVSVEAKPRKKTRPGKLQKQMRMDEKQRRAKLKRLRGKPADDS